MDNNDKIAEHMMKNQQQSNYVCCHRRNSKRANKASRGLKANFRTKE
jgi:hypothetical protein